MGKVKQHHLDQFGEIGFDAQPHPGELTNRLYALHELNQRENKNSDRKTYLLTAGAMALGVFLIAAAIVGAS